MIMKISWKLIIHVTTVIFHVNCHLLVNDIELTKSKKDSQFTLKVKFENRSLEYHLRRKTADVNTIIAEEDESLSPLEKHVG